MSYGGKIPEVSTRIAITRLEKNFTSLALLDFSQKIQLVPMCKFQANSTMQTTTYASLGCLGLGHSSVT